MPVSDTWAQRVLSTFILGVLIFAPAPQRFGDNPEPSPTDREVLGSRVLSPTFDEGLPIRGSRSSFESPGQRNELGRFRTAAMPALSLYLAALLLAGIAVIRMTSNLRPDNLGKQLGSRGPPVLISS